ncbi:MAG: sialate O-acetylesterase [Acidobacteria bacterium]|nr:sialate O-acetylesterase [Acidobacteriota bacterium]
MKKVFLIITCLFLACNAAAQQPAAAKPDENYLRPYYVQKVSLHRQLAKTKNGIVFVGDSITDGNEWAEQLNCLRCQNRGISGDISAGVLARLDDILAQQPAKIFLMIGINDISRNIPNERIIRNYKEFVRRTRTSSPKTRIYLQSVLPTNDTFRKFVDKNDESIKVLNNAMEDIARSDKAVIYVDLFSRFLDADGRLDKRYTNDGLHLLGEGYVLWASILKSRRYLK